MGLSATDLSLLVGASVATVYRWEACKSKEVVMDPAQSRVLALLDEQIDLARLAGKVEDLAGKIQSALLTRGALFGLYVLLDHAFREKAAS